MNYDTTWMDLKGTVVSENKSLIYVLPTVKFYLYTTLKMTKLHWLRTDQELPTVKAGGEGVTI